MIYYLILNALFIWGWHVLFNEGMILGKLGEWMTEKLPEWLHKPLFSCPACQSSIYGTIGFFMFVREELYIWPIYCVCLCGLNYLLAKLTSKERIIINE